MSLRSGKRDSHSENSRVLTLTSPEGKRCGEFYDSTPQPCFWLWDFWPCRAPARLKCSASIAGNVKDTSGAVLPGVTVEAASPALIEKVRTAVTDGSGQYRSSTCRPETTPSRSRSPGSARSEREAVEVSAGFTVNINAELQVGAIEETITVTGESRRGHQVRGAGEGVHVENMKVLPSSGSWIRMAAQRSGDSVGEHETSAACRAIRSARRSLRTAAARRRRVVDGRLANRQHVHQLERHQHGLSQLLFDQVDIQLSGQSGESGTNGVLMNIIPERAATRSAVSIWSTARGQAFRAATSRNA